MSSRSPSSRARGIPLQLSAMEVQQQEALLEMYRKNRKKKQRTSTVAAISYRDPSVDDDLSLDTKLNGEDDASSVNKNGSKFSPMHTGTGTPRPPPLSPFSLEKKMVVGANGDAETGKEGADTPQATSTDGGVKTKGLLWKQCRRYFDPVLEEDIAYLNNLIPHPKVQEGGEVEDPMTALVKCDGEPHPDYSSLHAWDPECEVEVSDEDQENECLGSGELLLPLPVAGSGMEDERAFIRQLKGRPQKKGRMSRRHAVESDDSDDEDGQEDGGDGASYDDNLWEAVIQQLKEDHEEANGETDDVVGSGDAPPPTPPSPTSSEAERLYAEEYESKLPQVVAEDCECEDLAGTLSALQFMLKEQIEINRSRSTTLLDLVEYAATPSHQLEQQRISHNRQVAAVEKEYREKMVAARIRRAEKMVSSFDDDYCAVCADGDYTEDNQIVFCDSCNMAVHQHCYGIEEIPKENWYCQPCASGTSVSCVLCPIKKGAFKQTIDGMWVHVACALWVPETVIVDPHKVEPIDGITAIPKDRWKLTCSICRIETGAPIQCTFRSCVTAFHPLCARNAGMTMQQVETPTGFRFEAYCLQHTDSQTTKLEAERQTALQERQRQQKRSNAGGGNGEGARGAASRGGGGDVRNKKKERKQASLAVGANVVYMAGEVTTQYAGDDVDMDRSVCAICLVGESDETNQILFCDKCDVAVHQDCYGVLEVPEDDWLCYPCSKGIDNPECSLCPVRGGAFKPNRGHGLSHVMCCIWIPECHFGNKQTLLPVVMSNVPKERRKLVCTICRQKHGVCIQCSSPSCYVAFHPLCARICNFFMDFEGGEGDCVEPKGYCPRHAPNRTLRQALPPPEPKQGGTTGDSGWDLMEVETLDRTTCTVCLKSNGPPNSSSNDVVTAVNSAPDDLLVCSTCELTVHAHCYGTKISKSEREKWTCILCTAGISVRCSLCPVQGGALVPTDEGGWAHLFCARWMKELEVHASSNGVEKKSRSNSGSSSSLVIKGVDKIPKKRFRQNCSLCRQKQGACVKCSVPSCSNVFHPYCGRTRGLWMVDDGESREDKGDREASHGYRQRQLLCKSHSDRVIEKDPTARWADIDALEKEDNPPPPTCQVCMRQLPLEVMGGVPNPVLECIRCDLRVHMSCYAISTFNGVGWLCTSCQTPTAPHETRCCGLCGFSGGAMKPMADEGWCHVVCALWTPGITFGEAEKLEPVVGVKEIVASRPPTKCEFCEKEGQCLACDEPECERRFHPLCGLEKGNRMTAVLDPSDMRVLLTTKCSHHSKPLTPEELFLQLTPDLWHDPTLIAHRFGRRLRRELDRARNALWLVVRREKMKRKLIRTTNEFFDQEIADWEEEKKVMLQEEKRRKKEERDAKKASYLLSLGTRTSRHRPPNDDRDVEGSSNNSIATTKPNLSSERVRRPSGADANDNDGGVANDHHRRTGDGDARPSRLSLKRKSTDSAVESSGDHSSTRRNTRQSVGGNGQRTLDNFFGSSSDSSVKKPRTPTSPSKERIPRALADILPSPVKPKKSPNQHSPVKPKKSPNQHPPDSPPRGKRLSTSNRRGSNRLSLRKR